MHRKLPAALAVIVAFALTAHADELVTKSGTKYTGRIVSEDDSTVTIDTAALGRLNLAKADLAKVSRDPKPGAKGDAAGKPGEPAGKSADPAGKPADPAA